LALELEKMRLENKVRNQRIAGQPNTVQSARNELVQVLNRTQQNNRTQGQNTPKMRGVTTAGGVLSTRDSSLMWSELGNTDDGRNWALAALHPCCENLPPVQGIPDRSSQPIATPSYRNTSTVSMPASLSTTTWDCQLVMVPIPEIDYIWRARANAAAAWSSWFVVRPAAFPGNADGSGVSLGSIGYDRYRMMGRGYTIHLLANATQDQGIVVAGQISATDLNYVAQVPNTEGATGNSQSPVLTNYQVPSGTQGLTQQDNLATEWEARHGTYMPLRFDQTVEYYVDCGDGAAVNIADGIDSPDSFVTISSALTEGGAITDDNPVVVTPVPTFTPPANFPPALSMIYAASQQCNQLIGCQFFTGLDVSASLQVKSRMHIEATVLSDGTAVQPFVHSSPVLDNKAMGIVATVAQVQKHCYYAEYNDLGKILTSIWNAIWPIGKTLASGAVSFIPGIGGGLSSLASGVKNPFAGKDWWSNL
jgi:hypothetical protein